MLKKTTQFCIAIFIFSLVSAFGIYLYFQETSFLWYWVLGLGFGFILQRFRICFVSAASDPIIMGSTEQFRSILIGILIASLGILSLKYMSFGMLDMLGVSGVTLPLMFGAFLFGIGMILSGCCSAGVFVRLAEGYTIQIFTFAGLILGFLFANSHYEKIWTAFVANSPSIFLPSEIGWPIGIIAHIVIIILLYLVALKHESDISSSNTSNCLKGCILLAILCIIHCIVLQSNWSVIGAFYWLSEWLNEGFSFTENSQTFAASGAFLRNFGLFTGAFLSVFVKADFRIQKIRSLKQISIKIIGGFFMGYGACIAGGCTVSAFFTAAASLSLSAWVFMIFLFIGTFVGIKLLYKLL